MNVEPVLKAKKRKRRKASTDRRVATELHSLIVRSKGYCEAAGRYDVDCSTLLNCCHIIRRARSGVRTDLGNAFCACTAHHAYLDNHIIDLIDFVGEHNYTALQRKADNWTEEHGSSVLFWADERERLTEIARRKGLIR